MARHAADGSRSCQPQLSFIVRRIYGSVYTGADTRPSRSFVRFISARSLVYPRSGQRSTAAACLTAYHLLPDPRISGCVARVPVRVRPGGHRPSNTLTSFAALCHFFIRPEYTSLPLARVIEKHAVAGGRSRDGTRFIPDSTKVFSFVSKGG